MIKIIEGNIVDSQAKVVCQQVNCQGEMNSGVAKAIRDKYPHIYESYKEFCEKRNEENLPLMGMVHFNTIDNKQVYINMFAQDKHGYDGEQYTNYDALQQCFEKVKVVLKDRSVAFPYKVGCGLGGGDWNVVLKMIETVFADYNVELWKYNND